MSSCRSPSPERPDEGGVDVDGRGPAFGDRCDESSVSQQPDLMGLAMDFRANVAAMSEQGVLAVRYSANGCDVKLEVLPNCIGQGRYSFSAYPGNETRIASNQTELFAKLPLGAAALEGKLAVGNSIRTDYRFAGMMTLPIGQRYEQSSLAGQDCDRATHVVNRIYLGGFALVTGKTREIAAAATVFGVGAGGGNAYVGELVSSEGLAASCEEAQRAGSLTPQCRVPLRLGLQAIADFDPDAYAPDADGFVPLLVVDEHNCRANEEVWNGTRCESISAPTTADDLLFRDEHGCAVGQEVYYEAKGKCVPAAGNDIYNGLQMSSPGG
ncbi:MAG: hypothetical protein AAF799_13715 [Myxococcota bacterium]